jgi:predicted RecB family nuclease
MAKRQDRKGLLLGIGLDNKDGHKRITKADDFSIVGGSEETHEKLTETAIKTVEDLSKKGKSIHTAEIDEIRDIVNKHSQT